MHLAWTYDAANTDATSQSREKHKDVTIHLEKHIAAYIDAAKAAAAVDNCSLKPEHAIAACPGGPHAGGGCMVGLKNKKFPLLAHCAGSSGNRILGPSPIVWTTHIYTYTYTCCTKGKGPNKTKNKILYRGSQISPSRAQS